MLCKRSRGFVRVKFLRILDSGHSIVKLSMAVDWDRIEELPARPIVRTATKAIQGPGPEPSCCFGRNPPLKAQGRASLRSRISNQAASPTLDRHRSWSTRIIYTAKEFRCDQFMPVAASRDGKRPALKIFHSNIINAP